MPANPTGPLRLTSHQAALLHLAAQGLLHRPRRRATPTLLLQAIDRMRLLQIDTIHVVARSPYLVLFSRIGAYTQSWLDDALEAGAIAECWAHEACFVPGGDYPLHSVHRPLRARHWAHRRASRMHREHPDGMNELLAHVREHGAVKSSDFAGSGDKQAGAGWWSWKLEKRWLEAWFALGELMVARRDRFQRVYELSERVLPRLPMAFPGEMQSPESARARFIVDSVRALGVTPVRWIGDYFRIGRVGEDELAEPLAHGELLPVAVGDRSEPFYVHRDHVDLLHRAARGTLRATHTTLLSPFDPVIWDRGRARDMLGFDYALECYTPAPRRRYGYFVLPILHRGRLIGRLDAKAHRGEGMFEVKALYLEEGVAADAATAAAIGVALVDAAQWHETPKVLVRRTEPRGLASLIRRAMAT